MGRRIIKKDNGLFAVWTTICDDFLMDDATKKEVIEYLSEDAKQRAIEDLERQFEHNLHMHMDYEERCDRRDEIHGKKDDVKNE